MVMIFIIFNICYSLSEQSFVHSNDLISLNEQKCLSEKAIIEKCADIQQPVSLFDCVFNSFKCKPNGGAIYFVSKAASRSTFEELKFVNNTASNAGAFYYSPFSFARLCGLDLFNS